MKKRLILLACVLLLFSFTACKKTEQSTPQTKATDKPGSSEEAAGGWSTSSAGPVTEDALEAFKLATSDLEGITYEPVALLGTQVVAGMKYAILCKGTACTEEKPSGLYVVVIYRDLENGASILNQKAFNISDYTG